MDRDSSNFGDFWGFTYLRKIPNFGEALGTFWGRGQSKFWGFNVVYPQKTSNFGDGDGVTAPKMFGDALGMGKAQTLGIFGEKSPKIPKFRSGDGGNNLGDFYHTMTNLCIKLNLYSLSI